MAAGRRKREQDRFGARAKKDGYAARSVYKLSEIDRRIRLLRRGGRVLDLGASPGSWSQYAAEQVGQEGRVTGIDLNPARVALPPHARFLEHDVTTLDPADLGGPGSFDVVLSDMAPRTSGQRHADQYLSFELYMRALEITQALLTEGGKFVGKIFQGAEFQDARKATAQLFKKVRIIKPEAVRSESYEVYIVGLDFRGPAEKSPPGPD